MRIKFIQDLIDKIRKKNKDYLIDNKENLFAYYCDGYHKIKYKSKFDNFNIIGKNNKIIFISSNPSEYMPKGLNISIRGNNNLIIIEEPNFGSSSIDIAGDNNLFSLKKTLKSCNGAQFFLDDGGKIEIDKNCEIGNGNFVCIVNGDYDKSHGLFIGEGTHIAREAIIRTSDGECLLGENDEPISEPQNVIIGKHCWITSRCTILKRTNLPDGTICAANSLINKEFTEENTLIGGVPAKVLKSNVKWNEGSYKVNMENNFGNNTNIEIIDWNKYLIEKYNITL